MTVSLETWQQGILTRYQINGDTEEEVLQKCSEIQETFGHAYGTSFFPPVHRSNGTWYALGSRYNSAD